MNKMNLIGKKLALLMLLSTSYVSAMAPNANNEPDSLLLRLPTDVTAVFCKDWLTLEEEAKVDSALTNRKERKFLEDAQKSLAARDIIILDNKNVTDDDLKSILSKFQNTKDLSLKNCTNLTGAALIDIATHCAHLKHLNLEGWHQFKRPDIITLVKLCPELETINLSWNTKIDKFWASIKNPGFVEIANNCPNLITADFCRTYIHDEGINAFLKKCLKLKTLKVGGRVSITNAAFNGLEINAMLTHLHITGPADITEEGFIVIAVSFPNLIMANFPGCRGLTDKGVEMLAKKCGNLVNLNFYACTLTDLSAESLTMYLPKLEKINLGYTGITDIAVDYLASSYNQSLIEVDIFSNYGITDEANKSLVTHCKNITKLNVSDCKNLTEVSFKAIAENLHKLIWLNFCELRRFQESSITLMDIMTFTQDYEELKELQKDDSTETTNVVINEVIKRLSKKLPQAN
ncbi:MAG: hypothetical protein V4544_06050 [Pseudomonadota bacterium]